MAIRTTSQTIVDAEDPEALRAVLNTSNFRTRVGQTNRSSLTQIDEELNIPGRFISTPRLSQAAVRSDVAIPSVAVSITLENSENEVQSLQTEPSVAATTDYSQYFATQDPLIQQLYGNEMILTLNQTDPSYTVNNITINTNSEKSFIIAGIVRDVTNLVDVESIDIYNTDKDIYFTGIDNRTTQQYVTINSPGGYQGQIQYNWNGELLGDSALTYNPLTQTLITQNLAVLGTTGFDIDSVKIFGGSPGQVLTTDGDGNISWKSNFATLTPYAVAYADAAGVVTGSTKFKYDVSNGYYVLNDKNLVDNPANVEINAASANNSTVSGGTVRISAGGVETGGGTTAGSVVIAGGAINSNGNSIAQSAEIVISGSTDNGTTTPIAGNINLNAGPESGTINFQTGGGSRPLYNVTFTGYGEWLLHQPNISPVANTLYSQLNAGAIGQVITSQGNGLPPIWANAATSLGELTDINLSSPLQDGMMLVYNETDQEWETTIVLDKQIIDGGEYAD